MNSGLAVTSTITPAATVLRLQGALDLPGTVELLDATTWAALAGPRTVICDLTELKDPAHHHLLTVFAAAQRRLGLWPDRDLQVAAASPAIERHLARLGIHRYVTMQPTVGQALAAARAAGDVRRCHVRLEAEPTSPAQARRSLATFLGDGQARWDEVAPVVVSELTTNAVRHVHQSFTLHLALGTAHMLVGVTDPSRQEPILRPRRPEAGGGRGIQLVDAVSQSWGVRLIHGVGKTVWANMTPAMVRG